MLQPCKRSCMLPDAHALCLMSRSAYACEAVTLCEARVCIAVPEAKVSACTLKSRYGAQNEVLIRCTRELPSCCRLLYANVSRLHHYILILFLIYVRELHLDAISHVIVLYLLCLMTRCLVGSILVVEHLNSSSSWR